MSRLIDADKMCDDLATVDQQYETMIDWVIRVTKAQPTVDAVPISWINKHLEWLDNCDNDFAQLAKVSILGMLELWRKDGMLNEQAN